MVTYIILGDSGNVLEGLYVVDGAILPIAVGVNPTLTISCLAERCLRLLAKREGWHIDYDTFKPLGELYLPYLFLNAVGCIKYYK